MWFFGNLILWLMYKDKFKREKKNNKRENDYVYIYIHISVLKYKIRFVSIADTTGSKCFGKMICIIVAVFIPML